MSGDKGLLPGSSRSNQGSASIFSVVSAYKKYLLLLDDVGDFYRPFYGEALPLFVPAQLVNGFIPGRKPI
jgi:hypothetical protein